MKSDREEHPPHMALVLDIDENLMVIKLKDVHNPREHLSSSAQHDLSTSFDGNIENPQLKQDIRGISVTAHRRGEWKQLLERVNAINEQYKALNPDDKCLLINVFVMTNAEYEPNHIQSILTHFYDNSDQPYLKELIPEKNIFNRDFIKKVLAKQNITFQGAGYEKGLSMKMLLIQPFFKEYTGIQETQNILLIDDQPNNIKGFSLIGFQAVLNPTNIHPSVGRPANITYTEQKNSVFEAIGRLIGKAEIYLDSLRQNEVTKKPRIMTEDERAEPVTSSSNAGTSLPDAYNQNLQPPTQDVSRNYNPGLFGASVNSESQNSEPKQKKRKNPP